MNQSSYSQNWQQLQQLMQQSQVASIGELSEISGISELQINRLLYGLLPKMSVEFLLKLAEALQISPQQLLNSFIPEADSNDLWATPKTEVGTANPNIQPTEAMTTSLKQQWQQSVIEQIESWLIQWPTAATAATKHPELSATKLLPLVKPVEAMIRDWGIEAIASVGEEVPFDPTIHQLMEGEAAPGDAVRVRYVGYRQSDKLLYRAKVTVLGNK